MRKRNRLFFFLFTVIIAVAIFIGWQLFGPTINAPQSNFLFIRTGSTYQNVKDDLLKNSIVNHINIFDRVAKYVHYERSVKPGKI